MTPLARRLLAVLALVLALAGAFVGGRFSAPLKVEVREVEGKAAAARVVVLKGKTETKIVYRDRVVTPDGTVKERSVEKTASREDLERDSKVSAESFRSSSTVTTARPDWRVGVLAGASLQAPAVPLAGPLVLGVQLERRITGGLSAGAWASTSGAAGAIVSLEF